MHARTAPGFSSLRRLAAAAALVAGFAAGTAPARADGTNVGGYIVNTTPPPSSSTATYGTGTYGTGSSTGTYGTGSTTDTYGTGSTTDTYGTGGSGQ